MRTTLTGVFHIPINHTQKPVELHKAKTRVNSPKKKQVAKKAVSVAPAKRSEKQEQRSSVLGDITSARKELEKQRREAPTKEKHKNIEI